MQNVAFVVLFLFAGCAGGAYEEPAITTRNPTTIAPQERIDLTHENVIKATDFAATREQLWKAMLAAHGELGFAVVAMDEKAGAASFQYESRIGSMLGKPTAHYVDCGLGSAGPRVNTYRVTIKVTQSVESEHADRTRLLSVIDATARSPGMNTDPVQCTSLGTLEKHIVGMVAAKLN